jgi:hypothetical protein
MRSIRRDICMIAPREARAVPAQPITSVRGFDFWLIFAAGHPAGMRSGESTFVNRQLGDELLQAVEGVHDVAARMIALVPSSLAAPHAPGGQEDIRRTNAASAPSPERFDGYS